MPANATLAQAGQQMIDDEPSPAWIAETLGVSLQDAEWLLVHYRFLPSDPAQRSPRIFYCEAL